MFNFKKLITKTILLIVFCVISLFFTENVVTAHEVYVLDQETIDAALQNPPLQVFSIIYAEQARFFFWMFLTILVLVFVGVVSVSKRLEAVCDPFLLKLRRFAPFIGRVTLGLSIIASGYFSALFGPELPLSMILPVEWIDPFRAFLIIAGILLVLGFMTRVASLAVILVYVFMMTKFSYYMLTYINYFGEMVIAFALGSRVWAVDRLFAHQTVKYFKNTMIFVEEHAFFILRLAFGTSLLFSAFYAKFLHAQLAIETVVQYNLTDYFHFSPSFIVLGAFAVELLLGTLFILGIEVRFAAIFLTVFLAMSLLYFGEAVWPHLILVGGAATIFAYGYGRFTLERSYLNKHHRNAEEPVF